MNPLVCKLFKTFSSKVYEVFVFFSASAVFPAILFHFGQQEMWRSMPLNGGDFQGADGFRLFYKPRSPTLAGFSESGSSNRLSPTPRDLTNPIGQQSFAPDSLSALGFTATLIGEGPNQGPWTWDTVVD